MDVCVVTYRNDAGRIRAALRPGDELWVRDNTSDNIGFGRAANELASRGHQPVILFVNPDGDPAPDCLERLERALDDPCVVAAEAALSVGYQWDSSPERLSWLSGVCLVVRRSAFETVGGFDPRLFLYGEDIDLSWRLAPLGKLEHCDDALFCHDRHAPSWRRLYRMERSALAVYAWHEHPIGRRMLKDGLANLARGEVQIGTARLVALVAHRVKPL
jgi:GT2 family glycosyltransferase